MIFKCIEKAVFLVYREACKHPFLQDAAPTRTHRKRHVELPIARRIVLYDCPVHAVASCLYMLTATDLDTLTKRSTKNPPFCN